MKRKPVETYAQARSRTGMARLVGPADRLFGDRLFFLLGRLLAHLTIEGEEHIPATGPCLLPMNHVALMTDSLVLFTIRRRRPDAHLFGWQTLSGENPIYRFLDSFGRFDVETQMLRAYKARGLSAGELLRARQVLHQGGAIVLAAEGEITWDGRLQHPLAPGTAWLALRTGAPVVPVVSSGGYDIQPRWQLEKIRLTGRITIRAGQPLLLCEAPLTRLTDETLEAANQRVWEAIAALLLPR